MAITSKQKQAGLTPMMQQYRRIKHEIPSDALLLFRLGDFYEMFFDDALESSHLLNLTLTNRNGIPMCGIPHHASENYIGKLLRAGRKVAICDQLEEAKPGKLVKRDVTQILSPSTHFDTQLLEAERNNYLATVYQNGHGLIGFSLVDLTTGDFRVTEFPSVDQLNNELSRVGPSEMIVSTEQLTDLEAELDSLSLIQINLTGYDGWTFEQETAFFTLRDHFKTQSLDGFGARELSAGISAAGAALHYLQNALRRNTAHIHRLHVYRVADFMALDAITQRNLELFESDRSDRKHSLIECIDRTLTPMGSRLLREWITHPLKDVSQILARQVVISQFYDSPITLDALREQLREVRDMERTVARLAVGNGNARDLIALKNSLAALPSLKQILETFLSPVGKTAGLESNNQPVTFGEKASAGLLDKLSGQIKPLPDLKELIIEAIEEAPPLSLKDGGIIKTGYSSSLDELRNASSEGKAWIAALQQREIERTEISSLKVRFNSVFGYYIEVTKSNLAKVPAEYIRKQTTAGAERFITPELKEMESKILGANERAAVLEYEMFLQIRTAVVEKSSIIQQIAEAIAELDVLAGFTELARHHNYCRPSIGNDKKIEIIDGRHPVLEQTLIEDRFVPNDTVLNGTDDQLLIITGPNMAGKSTYIRQVALLVLLAQTGSYIPAAKASIGVVDRIFTRVGATDDLARGQSTFMVEMNETANILNNATSTSLVILDEIGRGTSTFDGLSIAWAVAEYLHNVIGAKTLFATHYHELTDLSSTLPRAKNYNVAVREWNDQVIFLRKILPGGTDKSYGIQVARLAGLPKDVVERAKEVLDNLEEAELSAEGQPKLAKRKRTGATHPSKIREAPQMYLFGDQRMEDPIHT